MNCFCRNASSMKLCWPLFSLNHYQSSQLLERIYAVVITITPYLNVESHSTGMQCKAVEWFLKVGKIGLEWLDIIVRYFLRSRNLIKF